MDKYNGYAIRLSTFKNKTSDYSALAKYRQFTKTKRGHDDEINRVRVFKTRDRARTAKAYLTRKFGKIGDIKIKIVKVFTDVQVLPDSAKKALD